MSVSNSLKKKKRISDATCCTYIHRLQFHLPTWVTLPTLLGSV